MTTQRLLLSLSISLLIHAVVLWLFGLAPQEFARKPEVVMTVHLQEGKEGADFKSGQPDAPAVTPAALPKTSPHESRQTIALEKVTSYQKYLLGIKTQIERHWDYTSEVLPDKREISTLVCFIIDQEGKLRGWNIESSSGSARLDQIALQAVQKAAPFEKIPAALKLSRLQVLARFQYDQSLPTPRPAGHQR